MALEQANTHRSLVPHSLEAHADVLMDELFGGVEQLLETSPNLPPSPQDTFACSEPLGTKLETHQESIPRLSGAAQSSRSSGQQLSLSTSDWALVGLGCFSLVAALGIAGVHLGVLSLSFGAQAPTPKSMVDKEFNPTESQSVDPDLADQPMRAEIPGTGDRLLQTDPGTNEALETEPREELTAAMNRLATALEKSAVPPPSTTVNQPPILPVAVAPSITEIPPPPQSLPEVAPTPLVVSGEVTPLSSLPPSPPSNLSTLENGNGKPIYALVGVLEFGDRLAALVDINGRVSPVYVGEQIGSSTWSLAKVTNKTAVIEGNGQRRSLEIGQHF